MESLTTKLIDHILWEEKARNGLKKVSMGDDDKVAALNRNPSCGQFL